MWNEEFNLEQIFLFDRAIEEDPTTIETSTLLARRDVETVWIILSSKLDEELQWMTNSRCELPQLNVWSLRLSYFLDISWKTHRVENGKFAIRQFVSLSLFQNLNILENNVIENWKMVNSLLDDRYFAINSEREREREREREKQRVWEERKDFDGLQCASCATLTEKRSN